MAVGGHRKAKQVLKRRFPRLSCAAADLTNMRASLGVASWMPPNEQVKGANVSHKASGKGGAKVHPARYAVISCLWPPVDRTAAPQIADWEFRGYFGGVGLSYM